jgi:hypothetical protein
VKALISAVLLTWSSVEMAAAADVYVVRFNTLGSPVFAEPPCTYLSYRDELVFRNAGTSKATVRLLGVSNGPAQTPRDLIIPEGETRSTEGEASAVAATWAPTTPQPLLWVDRLDVPDGVQIVSRLLVPAYPTAFCEGGSQAARRTYAGIRMPVVRELTAAGVRQVHLATDIGGDAGEMADDGRTNVGVFNAGLVAATATVEIRRGCDDVLVASRSVAVPPNTIVQLNGFPFASEGCSAIHTAAYETYVVVTVDQPGFSYAITLSNQRPPWIPVSSSP